MNREIQRLVTWLIALYAILGSVAFFIIQTGKFLNPEAAEAKMDGLPYGRFDWGYVWSDTLIAGPMLLFGGIFLLIRNRPLNRLGRLFVFAGFTINLYAMIFLWIGSWVVGQPVRGIEFWGNVVLTFLGILSMIHLAILTMKEQTPLPESGN